MLKKYDKIKFDDLGPNLLLYIFEFIFVEIVLEFSKPNTSIFFNIVYFYEIDKNYISGGNVITDYLKNCFGRFKKSGIRHFYSLWRPMYIINLLEKILL